MRQKIYGSPFNLDPLISSPGLWMIRVGCCGFPVKRETYYKSFSVVEIQQTFYQLPRTTTGEKWRQEAPPNFEFSMKAWQLITHEPSSPTYRRLRMVISEKKKMNYGSFKETEEVEGAWAKTAEFATALGVKKIIFQSPASFHPSDDSIRNLKQFFKKEKTRSFIFIWEPRGKWKREVVERLCEELGIVPCLAPFEGRSIRGDLLYLRLHGSAGYRCSYSEAEMRELIQRGETYPLAFMMFNNVSMYEDALHFKKLLEEKNGKRG